jgi:hypothetical protein
MRKQRSESLAMIHLNAMAQLVSHDVVHQVRRQKQQFGIQRDGGVARTARPSGLLALYDDAPKTKPNTSTHD